MAEQRTIAVLGAGGTMGFPIAVNLAGAGFPVRAWNRSRDKADPLADHGVTVCDSAAEAVAGADVVLTMLADADAVIATLEDALTSARTENLTWLQMSTIGEEGIDRCVAFAKQHGLVLVDVPVLGTKQPAEQAELLVMASGPDSVRDELEPLFSAIGRRTMWVGEAGAASRLKVATNAWIVTVVEGAAEVLALAEGMGLDPQLLLDAVSGGALDLPYLQTKGKAMIARDFTPSMKFTLAAKDASLVEASAARHDLDLPIFQTIAAQMRSGAAEHPDEDMAATYLTSSPISGSA